jgi:hypothetical protein
MNTFGFITTRECVNTLPPPDARCQDEAFAIANPSICAATPHLVIKPGTALTCGLGGIQFKAYLVTSGVEVDVSDETIWTSSNHSIVLIGASSGNATGISAGEANISAAYEDYTAMAGVTVMGNSINCCEDATVAMMMLIDTSQSMSQEFGSGYNKRLDFAKAAAARFASEVNEAKDTIGLISFNAASVLTLDALTSDKATVGADVLTVAQTTQKTAFYNALNTAITALDAASVDLRVIVLFSDGLDTSSGASNGYVGTDNPLELISEFKASGGVVICLGCRASGTGFAFLSLISTGGFFINGYPDANNLHSASDALEYLSGLKGYICAGNCTPAGDLIVGEGELNYKSFTNWNVTGGSIDLMGNGFLDFLPGNGLYVDLAGSYAPVVGPGSWGRMVSKTPFTLTAGHQYRLSLSLAGNQLQPGTYTVKAEAFYLTGATEVPLLSQVIVISDYTQDFTDYSYIFTAPDVAVDAYLAIQLVAMNQQVLNQDANKGVLLGEVKFDDFTNYFENLLTDDFDDENPVYVPPKCGTGTLYVNGAYAVGYNCYGEGCLDTPPPAQLPDPHPLEDFETGSHPPAIYTSTKSITAVCPPGSIYLTPLPFAYVSSAMGPPLSSIVQLTGGAAIVNAFSVGPAGYGGISMPGFVLYGSNNGTTWTQLFSADISVPPSTLGKYPLTGNATAYLYYKTQATSSPSIAAVPFILIAGFHSTAITSVTREATATGPSITEAENAAKAAAQELADEALTAGGICQPFWTKTVTKPGFCPTGTCGPEVIGLGTATSYFNETDALYQAGLLAIADAQAKIDADCTQSNNTQPASFPDEGPMAPFPMVKTVSGPTGLTITEVTVSITGLTHTWPEDIQLFLSHRQTDDTVTSVGLMRHCGGSFAISGVDLVFKDGEAALPATVIGSGTYAPTYLDGNPIGTWAFGSPITPPTPTVPTSFTLADFIGLDPNGSWSLWGADIAAGNTGTIAGGFDVTISTA